jgi:hypothetical protein
MEFCQNCGRRAPTKYIEIYQNIGALIVRFTKSIKGNLCKKCINDYFWPYTLTTLILGWWGIISFIITPFILLNNIGRYLVALPLPHPRMDIESSRTRPTYPTPIRPTTFSIADRPSSHQPQREDDFFSDYPSNDDE